eukprot:4363614-Amphidinium_carterae.1
MAKLSLRPHYVDASDCKSFERQRLKTWGFNMALGNGGMSCGMGCMKALMHKSTKEQSSMSARQQDRGVQWTRVNTCPLLAACFL